MIGQGGVEYSHLRAASLAELACKPAGPTGGPGLVFPAGGLLIRDRHQRSPEPSEARFLVCSRTAGGQVRRFYVPVPARAANDMLAVALAWRALGESFWLERVDRMATISSSCARVSRTPASIAAVSSGISAIFA